MPNYEEGDPCPSCSVGTLEFESVKDCSCHINPPCRQCVDNPLTCSKCGWDESEPIKMEGEFYVPEAE